MSLFVVYDHISSESRFLGVYNTFEIACENSINMCHDGTKIFIHECRINDRYPLNKNEYIIRNKALFKLDTCEIVYGVLTEELASYKKVIAYGTNITKDQENILLSDDAITDFVDCSDIMYFNKDKGGSFFSYPRFVLDYPVECIIILKNKIETLIH